MHANCLMRTLSRIAPILCVLLVAPAAGANTPGMAELSTAQAKAQSPFGARIVGQVGMGTGTLIHHDYSNDPLVYSLLTLTPIYRLEELPFKPTLSLSQSLQWEHTQPNNVSDRRFQWSDTALSMASNNIYHHEATGIRLGGSLGASLPISYRSMNTHKITSTSASARALWMGGGFTLMGSLGATKHFYRYANEIREGEVKFDDGFQAVHCREGQEVCMGGRYALNWSTTAGLMATYSVTPKMAVTLDMAWTSGWRRAAPVDPFTSPNARDDNRTIDMTRALLNVSYVLREELSVSVGASTMQPLLTSDNRAWRNPLYDGHPRNNSTTFYLNAVYSI